MQRTNIRQSLDANDEVTSEQNFEQLQFKVGKWAQITGKWNLVGLDSDEFAAVLRDCIPRLQEEDFDVEVQKTTTKEDKMTAAQKLKEVSKLIGSTTIKETAKAQ